MKYKLYIPAGPSTIKPNDSEKLFPLRRYFCKSFSFLPMYDVGLCGVEIRRVEHFMFYVVSWFWMNIVRKMEHDNASLSLSRQAFIFKCF